MMRPIIALIPHQTHGLRERQRLGLREAGHSGAPERRARRSSPRGFFGGVNFSLSSLKSNSN